MHQDFLTAIARNESLSEVYERLVKIENKAYDQRRAKLYRDYEIADKVLLALHEPFGSAPWAWAQAFRKEAEEAESKKGDDQLRREEERRQIEAEYLEEKKKEIEYMRNQHSER